MFFSANSAHVSEFEESDQTKIQLPGPLVSNNRFAHLSTAESKLLLPNNSMRSECVDRLKMELPGLTSGRLGLRFELFLNCVLRTRYGDENVLSRVPVRERYSDGSEKTWGEFDFLIRNCETGNIEHWESSIKFYLQIRSSPAWKWCWGPGVKDRLDLKGRKTFLQQLALSSTELGQKSIPEDWRKWPLLKRVFAKGTIFYRWLPEVEELDEMLASAVLPNSLSDDHLKSWWIAAEDFGALRARFGQFHVAATPRRFWMIGLPVESTPIDSFETFDDFEKNLQHRLVEVSARQECLHVGFYQTGSPASLIDAGFVAGSHFIDALKRLEPNRG